jgi:hypothetical protein
LQASPFEDDDAVFEMFGEAVPNLELVSSHALVCIMISLDGVSKKGTNDPRNFDVNAWI